MLQVSSPKGFVTLQAQQPIKSSSYEPVAHGSGGRALHGAGLDDGPTADVQRQGLSIQFLKHWGGEVYVDSLNCRPDDGGLIREVA
jgi:hypothetical protein